MNSQTLSVLVPVFNEQRTVYTILKKLSDVELVHGLEKELVVINDCSTDKTEAQIFAFMNDFPNTSVVYKSHAVNRGKGAAIRTGIHAATGDFMIVQDADLEYDPREFNLLLTPILEGYADVVYGSRFMGGKPHRVLFFFHSIGNKFLTVLSNAFTNVNLTDMETCYKLFKADVLRKIELKENRFGFEPEVTSKVCKLPNIRVYEVGISYYGRTYQEGKKINWKDGLRAIYCILKYNLFAR